MYSHTQGGREKHRQISFVVHTVNKSAHTHRTYFRRINGHIFLSSLCVLVFFPSLIRLCFVQIFLHFEMFHTFLSRF